MSNILPPNLIAPLEEVDTFNDPIAAYQYMTKAEENAIQEMDQNLTAHIRLSLTKILLENGAYKEALTKVVPALNYFNTSGNLDQQANCWRYMGIIYGNLGNRLKQQAYNKKCYHITQGLNCSKAEIKILNNIGFTHYELGEYQKAITIFKTNLSKKEITPDLETVSLKNLALVYLDLKEYKVALYYCKKTRLTTNNHQLHKYLTACDYLRGKIYLEQGQYKEALPFLRKAVSVLTQKGSFKRELLMMSEAHLKVLTKLGLVKDIAHYTERYISLSKELHKKAKDQNLKHLQFQFEINEIEKERVLLIEQNEALQLANIKIENQKKALLEKSFQLESVNSELREFAHRIAHDLKQPIRTLNGFISILKKEVGNTLSQKGEKCIRYIASSSKDMEKFVDDLLLYAKSDQNSQPTEEVDCNDIIAQIQNQLSTQFLETNATLLVEKLPTIQAHPTLILQIFQNLISNALKFHQPTTPPVIKISSLEDSTNYIFRIQDNGIGIEKRHQKKVFQLFTQLNDKNKYEGSGIGLSTVVKVLRRYNATINLESIYGEGTTFSIVFPKPNN